MAIFVFVVIFALWSMYKIRKSSELDQKRSDAFWEQEHQADNVRRQDISQLDYVTIPFDALPFQANASEPVATYQNHILELKDQKILNLTGYTNTDLKMMYGPANLQDLMLFDSNYTTLVSNLGRWAKYCYENNAIEDAKTLLEYGIQIHSDVSSNYVLLGKIYLAQGDTNKIYELIDYAEDLRSLMKDSIVRSLHELLEQDANLDDILKS